MTIIFRKDKHICWSDAKHLEAHFDAQHKRLYDEWRCQNAGERMATTEEVCPNIDAPLSGVWADPVLLHPTAVLMDPTAMPGGPTAMLGDAYGSHGDADGPMAMPRDPTAMPGPTAAASSSSSTSRTAASPAAAAGADNSRDVFNVFAPQLTHCSESPDEDHTHEDPSLWQWMICYAQLQCAAQLLIDMLADEQTSFPAISRNVPNFARGH